MAAPSSSTPIERALQAALSLPTARIRALVDGLRRTHPQASPAEIIRLLEKRYLLAVSASGGAVGAVAAVPAVGTGVAVVLTGGQVAGFLAASGVLALAVADVHGIATDDHARRRALVLTALLGEDGPEIIGQQLGISALMWGRALVTRLPLATVKTVNKALRGKVVKATAAKAGSVMAGRLLPFGVGAVIGFVGGRVLGRQMVDGVRAAFGPAPQTFTREAAATFVVDDPFDRALQLDATDTSTTTGGEPQP